MGFPSRVEEEVGGCGVFQPPSYPEGTGYPTGALSIIRRAFVSAALANFPNFLHIVPCAPAVGAAPAVSGTIGLTPSGV